MIEEVIKKMWYIHRQWNFTQPLKNNEIMPLAAAWEDLEILILSAVKHRKRSIT